MNYKIIGDSCCDYTKHDGGMQWLTRVPLTIELGEERLVDDGTLDTGVLIEKMAQAKDAPKSACPSLGDFLDAFAGEQDDIYVVTLSEKISGTYNSAVQAAGMFCEDGAKKNIHVFNSRSASAGQIAVCLKIRELAESGLGFAQVVEQTETYIAQLETYFLLETLEVFRKNGRLSHLQSLVTSALNLKMIMGAEEDGTIGVKGKALTMERAIHKLIEIIKERLEKAGPLCRRLVITHCHCKERVALVRQRLLETFPVLEIILCRAGGLSTIYANKGGFIVSF